MMTLVTGGSKCGRSRYAEGLLEGVDGKIYLATMQPYGEDARRAIERHRKMREGKGFVTQERYTDIHELDIPHCGGILLECISNLLANEMFREDADEYAVDRIMHGIRHLEAHTEHLVAVTSQVGADGLDYAPETMRYIENMGRLNAQLAEMADDVTECVYGIAIPVKRRNIC